MRRTIIALALLVATPALAQNNSINTRNNVPTFRYLYDAQTYQALIAQGDQAAARQLQLEKSPNNAGRTTPGETVSIMHMKKINGTYFYCVRRQGQTVCLWTDDGAFL